MVLDAVIAPASTFALGRVRFARPDALTVRPDIFVVLVIVVVTRRDSVSNAPYSPPPSICLPISAIAF